MLLELTIHVHASSGGFVSSLSQQYPIVSIFGVGVYVAYLFFVSESGVLLFLRIDYAIIE